MKSHLQRLCALLLVCMVFTSIVVPASAAENSVRDNAAQEEKIDDWYIIEGRAKGQLFTIVANQVWYNLYSQSSNKGFATYGPYLLGKLTNRCSAVGISPQPVGN